MTREPESTYTEHVKALSMWLLGQGYIHRTCEGPVNVDRGVGTEISLDHVKSPGKI